MAATTRASPGRASRMVAAITARGSAVHGAELRGERARPPAVALRVDLHRDLAAAFVELQCAGAAGNAEVPVAASLAATQVALAADHQAASGALLEDPLDAEVHAELQHRTTVERPRVGTASRPLESRSPWRGPPGTRRTR